MKHVVQILQISASPDWWCTNDGGLTFEPVAMWAHCLVLDDSYVSLGAKPYLVGLVADEVGAEVTDLVNVFDREFAHRDEFSVVGEVLKSDRQARKAF